MMLNNGVETGALPGESLEAQAARLNRATRDCVVLDDIALLLGLADDWSSAADFLEDIANILSRSGRPHPGRSGDYEAEFDAYCESRSGA